MSMPINHSTNFVQTSLNACTHSVTNAAKKFCNLTGLEHLYRGYNNFTSNIAGSELLIEGCERLGRVAIACGLLYLAYYASSSVYQEVQAIHNMGVKDMERLYDQKLSICVDDAKHSLQHKLHALYNQKLDEGEQSMTLNKTEVYEKLNIPSLFGDAIFVLNDTVIPVGQFKLEEFRKNLATGLRSCVEPFLPRDFTFWEKLRPVVSLVFKNGPECSFFKTYSRC